MFAFLLNALPKIQSFAKTMIVIGNFALELFDMIMKTFSNNTHPGTIHRAV